MEDLFVSEITSRKQTLSYNCLIPFRAVLFYWFSFFFFHFFSFFVFFLFLFSFSSKAMKITLCFVICCFLLNMRYVILWFEPSLLYRLVVSTNDSIVKSFCSIFHEFIISSLLFLTDTAFDSRPGLLCLFREWRRLQIWKIRCLISSATTQDRSRGWEEMIVA